MADVGTEGKIMVVDDISSNRQIMSNMLKVYRYEVILAESGMEALEVIPRTMPDLILLDINMPEMNGYEVCTQIKDDPRTRDIPVIFISALNEIHDKVKGFQVGGVDYITKPFKMEEVLARVRSQITLARQRQQILALSKLKDQLIRTVSHDLKNPISIIMGYADMLTRPDGMSYEEISFMAGNIFQTADKMYDLVVDLLDISQLETNGLKIDLQPVLIADLYGAAVQDYHFMAAQKQLSILVEANDPGLMVQADPKRMMQVVKNLLSNAIKYTPAGGHITLAASQYDDRVLLQFIDTGLGIPKAAQAQLFDKFFRVETEAHLSEEGTGLGLAIVKGIVEGHGGQVWVESEPGRGSIFYVELPALQL